MAPLNFDDVLNTNLSEIERPPLIPVGHYTAQVIKLPSQDVVGKDQQYETVDFALQLISPGDDVDMDALKEYGGLGKHSVIQRRFMFNKGEEAAFKRSLFNLKRFVEDHLQVEDAKNKPLKQALNDTLNCQCIVFIKHRQDRDDKEVFYPEVSQTSPVV